MRTLAAFQALLRARQQPVTIEWHGLDGILFAYTA